MLYLPNNEFLMCGWGGAWVVGYCLRLFAEICFSTLKNNKKKKRRRKTYSNVSDLVNISLVNIHLLTTSHKISLHGVQVFTVMSKGNIICCYIIET